MRKLIRLLFKRLNNRQRLLSHHIRRLGINSLNFSVPLKQATMLKGISQNGELTYEKIDKIITQKMKQPSKVIKLYFKKIKEYFPNNTSPNEVEDVVVKALKAWFALDNTQDKDVCDELER